MSVQLFLQAFIVEKLRDVLSVPVLDHAGQDQTTAYVVVSDMSTTALDDSCTRRWEITATITVYSKYKGYSEVHEIGAKIDETLSFISEFGSEYNLIGIVPTGSIVGREDLKRYNEMTFNCIVSRQ